MIRKEPPTVAASEHDVGRPLPLGGPESASSAFAQPAPRTVHPASACGPSRGGPAPGKLDDARGAASRVIAVEHVDAKHVASSVARAPSADAEDQDSPGTPSPRRAVASWARPVGSDTSQKVLGQTSTRPAEASSSPPPRRSELDAARSAKIPSARRAVDVGAADRPRRDREAVARASAPTQRGSSGGELRPPSRKCTFRSRHRPPLYSPFIQERGRVGLRAKP